MGLVLGQAVPASAAYWNEFYAGKAAVNVLKSGVVGNLTGGKASLVLGTDASVYIRTYGPSGNQHGQQKAEGAGPANLSHQMLFDGTAKCMWTGGGTAPTARDMNCSDLRN